jgi:hypothetical protein
MREEQERLGLFVARYENITYPSDFCNPFQGSPTGAHCDATPTVAIGIKRDVRSAWNASSPCAACFSPATPQASRHKLVRFRDKAVPEPHTRDTFRPAHSVCNPFLLNELSPL